MNFALSGAHWRMGLLQIFCSLITLACHARAEEVRGGGDRFFLAGTDVGWQKRRIGRLPPSAVSLVLIPIPSPFPAFHSGSPNGISGSFWPSLLICAWQKIWYSYWYHHHLQNASTISKMCPIFNKSATHFVLPNRN